LCSTDLQHRLVRGVWGRGSGESAQDSLGRGGPVVDGGGVLDQLIVLLGNELFDQQRAEPDMLLGVGDQ